MMPTEKRPCPHCATGIIAIVEATVNEEYLPSFQVIGRDLPRRERLCWAAACNTCEFIVEIRPHRK